eukprot:GHVU01197072.1.p1 GENE.GHVU01197072.1~~GHVU01197072.1.p1  ORF type:complete len:492 (+),score=106.20 GHVU01197072.1:317-1792(+)
MESSNSRHVVLHILRHAEGIHNVAAREEGTKIPTARLLRDEKYFDPVLTARGLEQCREAGRPHNLPAEVREALQAAAAGGGAAAAGVDGGGGGGGGGGVGCFQEEGKENEDTSLRCKSRRRQLRLLCSPTMRTLQTARATLPAAKRVLLLDAIREHAGVHMCDYRRSGTEYRKLFEKEFEVLDMELDADDDPLRALPGRETREAVELRCVRFLTSLVSMWRGAEPSTVFVAVSHSAYVRHLLCVLGHLPHTDRSMDNAQWKRLLIPVDVSPELPLRVQTLPMLRTRRPRELVTAASQAAAATTDDMTTMMNRLAVALNEDAMIVGNCIDYLYLAEHTTTVQAWVSATRASLKDTLPSSYSVLVLSNNKLSTEESPAYEYIRQHMFPSDSDAKYTREDGGKTRDFFLSSCGTAVDAQRALTLLPNPDPSLIDSGVCRYNILEKHLLHGLPVVILVEACAMMEHFPSLTDAVRSILGAGGADSVHVVPLSAAS